MYIEAGWHLTIPLLLEPQYPYIVRLITYTPMRVFHATGSGASLLY